VQVCTIAADLTAPGSCQQLLQQLSDTPISVLIANVGGGICGPCVYWDYSDADETYVQQLNGTACYSLVKGLLPGMIGRNRGAVVAVSSIMHQVSCQLNLDCLEYGRTGWM
jgi:short-subunit dehydrogenase